MDLMLTTRIGTVCIVGNEAIDAMFLASYRTGPKVVLHIVEHIFLRFFHVLSVF